MKDDKVLIDKIIKIGLNKKEKFSIAKEFEALINLDERLDANMKGLIGEAITTFKSEANSDANKAIKEAVNRFLNMCVTFNKLK